MKNRFVLLLLALAASLAAASCAGPNSLSQVRIGVWAAEHDLWEEAVFRWSRALETDPDSAAARNNLAVAYEKMGRFEDARREYERALKLSPNHAHIRANFQRFERAVEPREETPAKKKDAEDENNDVR